MQLNEQNVGKISGFFGSLRSLSKSNVGGWKKAEKNFVKASYGMRTIKMAL